jgi:osmotically-inducible protein OsmY
LVIKGDNAMRRSYGLVAVTSLAVGMAMWAGISRAQQEGVAEKAGEKLDEVGRKIKQGFEKAEGAVREGFHKTRETVHGMGVMSRVYGRLHWDKALHSSSLTIKVEDGAVVLGGTVPNAAARIKAVNLAADTVGVTRVVDELSVVTSEAEGAPTPLKR